MLVAGLGLSLLLFAAHLGYRRATAKEQSADLSAAASKGDLERVRALLQRLVSTTRSCTRAHKRRVPGCRHQKRQRCSHGTCRRHVGADTTSAALGSWFAKPRATRAACWRQGVEVHLSLRRT